VGILRFPEPYDFFLSTARFRAFGPDLANLWHDGALHRVVDGREIRIKPATRGVRVEPLDTRIEPVVRHLLGEPFDLVAFTRFARNDPVLSRFAEQFRGFRPPLAPDPFEALVTSVTAQQISLRAAFAIRNRLIARFGDRGERAYAFPTRERLARAAPDDVAAAGLSRRKAITIIGLAQAELDLQALGELADDDVKRALVTLPGLGEWTADWFLARHLARPRAWPAGDLGLRKAVAAFYRNGDPPRRDIRAFGTRFAPFENLTAHYLLMGLLGSGPAT
jgi:3-methyladenine DNA glycosylase/8-oxoguanine DNA glycosylase